MNSLKNWMSTKVKRTLHLQIKMNEKRIISIHLSLIFYADDVVTIEEYNSSQIIKEACSWLFDTVFHSVVIFFIFTIFLTVICFLWLNFCILLHFNFFGQDFCRNKTSCWFFPSNRILFTHFEFFCGIVDPPWCHVFTVYDNC